MSSNRNETKYFHLRQQIQQADCWRCDGFAIQLDVGQHIHVALGKTMGSTAKQARGNLWPVSVDIFHL